MRTTICCLSESCDPEKHQNTLLCRVNPVKFSTLVLCIGGDVSLHTLGLCLAKQRTCVSCVAITRNIDFLFTYEENYTFCKSIKLFIEE